MPATNSGRENTAAARRKPAAKKPAAGQRVGGVGRGADTIPATPVAKPKPTGVFKPGVPKPATEPLRVATRTAQTKVDTARRALPPATVAAPPVVTTPGASKPSGKPITARQVQTFLTSQSKITLAARKQIVGSIRQNLGGTSGAERQAMTDRLLREIATDPRHAGTRKAIEHYTALERQTARPQTTAQIKAGPAPHKTKVGIGPLAATVNLTAASTAITNAAEKAAPGLRNAGPAAKFGKNALSDIAHLPLMVPQTAYEVGAAAVEAAGGDTKRAKKIAKGFTEGVYGLAVQGKWSELEAYVRDHPVYAILELRGGKGVGGRAAGATMRSGALGATAKRAASTARKDINLSGEGARVADRQHYSPDVITKAFQVLNERRRANPKTVLGRTVRDEARDHRLRRRADFESDTAAATSRAVRSDEAKQARAAKPKGPLAEVVGLVVQGVVRPASLEADLRKELGRLDHAHATAEFTTGAQKRQNRTTADAIRKVLGNPAAMARIGDVAQSGRANVRAINTLEQRAKDLNAIDPARADRAKLFPAAQAHLGAEYSDAPFRAARGREVAAGRDLRSEATRLRQRVAQAAETEQAALARVQTLAAKHKSDRGKEGYNQPLAAYHVGPGRFELRKDAVAAAKAAGIPIREIRRVALTSNEAKRVGEISKARRAAQSATRYRRAAVADLKALNKRGAAAVPARAAFEAARSERKAAGIGGTESLNVAGRRLPNSEILNVVGEDVAHLPHHTQQRGARAYYQTAFAGRKNLDSGKKRTGRAFEIGAVDVSYDAVKEHRIRMRGVVSRIAEHDRIIHSIAIKGPGGRMMTWDHAEKIASNAADKGAKLVPYRAVPGSYDRARIDRIAGAQGAAEGPVLEKLIEVEFAKRLEEPAPGDRTARNVVLVPEQIVNQLLEQHAVSGTRGKAGNVAADVFRRTVLPFSTKWLTGNIVEAGVRLAAVGAGPNAYRIGRNLLKEMDKLDREQAIRVRAALTGGLLFGNKGLTVRRVSEHFEKTALAKPAAAITVAGQLPVVKQLGHVMKSYTDAVFAFNRHVESAAQVAALGKHAQREMQEMTGSWAKATRAQEKALQDVANGLMDTKNIHDAARYIDQTLGQYSRFSPSMRKFIQQAAPFLPWYLNAVRFVGWTLPAKHPIKTAIYANVAANLQDDFDASHKGLPPGDLRGDIVTDGGTVLPYSRYVPFGAFGVVAGGGNEQLTSLVDPLFPQFKSAALAAFGLNFAGRKAKIDPADRTGQDVPGAVRATMAFNALLEAFVPVVGIAKRVREGGETGWDNSTIFDPKTKPGTRVKAGAANRILNPFRSSPIKAHPAAQATAAKSSSTVAAEPATLEDQLLNNLDQSLGDAQAQQALEDQLLNNLYGG